MRVTNGMIINSSLNGLYNNMNKLNKTYAQMVTGKKIQTVSDDPIIAGHALKIKTTVLETEQYESNVKEAQSWMDITGSNIDNIKNLLKTIRTKCVNGSTGTLDKENKQSIRTEIGQLWEQIQKEANGTYGGRYVFSGYKTNQPLILTKDYEIEDATFEVNKPMILGGTSKLKEDSIIKEGSQLAKGSILGTGTEIKLGTTIGAGTTLSKTDATALLGLSFEAGKYTFDKETKIPSGFELTKEQAQQLETDLGKAPGTIWTATEPTATKCIVGDEIRIDKGAKITDEVAEAIFGVKNATDVYTTTVSLEAVNTHSLGQEMTLGAGTVLVADIEAKGESSLATNSVLAEGSKLLVGSFIGKGSINPVVNGNINGHAIEYEIGVNSTIVVNAEGMDQIMGEMSKCFNEIFLSLDKALVDDDITITDLHNMFTRKLDEIDELSKQISEVASDLGSRMSRLDYASKRIAEQKITYKNLLTEIEDVDIEETYTQFNVQYATYQSALQATSKIITKSLADYL